MIKNFKKGQAALEFLTTYGWAFLVILIMVGALSYFGVFDVGRFVPDNCKLDGNIECESFTMDLGSNTANNAADDVIAIKIKNNRQERVEIRDISIKEKDKPDTAIDTNDRTSATLAAIATDATGVNISKGDDADVFFRLPGDSAIDDSPLEKKSYELIITYTVGDSSIIQKSSGVITGIASD